MTYTVPQNTMMRVNLTTSSGSLLYLNSQKFGNYYFSDGAQAGQTKLVWIPLVKGDVISVQYITGISEPTFDVLL